ncbi:hypothetical protein D11S_2330 (plasmid) [Aggregatibacter actinomycetemcomitans D11S-1]|nr:hypothetical protein D11S_2330 [Aggregatibacter actinomycetemcomitans D11S-1]
MVVLLSFANIVAILIVLFAGKRFRLNAVGKILAVRSAKN